MLCVTLFVQFQLPLQTQAPRAMVWDGLARRQLARLQNILGSCPAGTRPQLAALAQRGGLAQQGKPFFPPRKGFTKLGGWREQQKGTEVPPLPGSSPFTTSEAFREWSPLFLDAEEPVGGWMSSQSSWPSAHCLREGLGAQPTARVSNREMLVWKGPVDSFFFF